MSDLPIVRMTLYKHGVGFFERRATFEGDEQKLSFRVGEMNDILKSFTAIDFGGGQVLGIDYATPKSREERLAGCSIRLQDKRSLRDLLIGLRGRRVSLALDQGEKVEGILVGLDETNKEEEMNHSLISLLLPTQSEVRPYPLARIMGVEILDAQGAEDLRFFLESSLTQDEYRQLTIRLTEGAHQLAVSYIAPAPTWRVSYRLVTVGEGEEKEALLLGWGIFDNQLEEDLKEISLSLVAGMPISFVYDLYTPFTPERPIVEEEARVAAGPIDFEEAVYAEASLHAPPPAMAMARADSFGGGRMKRKSGREMQSSLHESTAVQSSGKGMGELFQYNINTPVSVGRGQSAMVPIVSHKLGYEKELLYNGAKMADHPVATLRLKNGTGLTLERGPVTVVEGDVYVGEAILPFTGEEGQINVPYAVELGVKIQERSKHRVELYRLSIEKGLLLFEEWEIRSYHYQLNNKSERAKNILVEHPRNSGYELYETAVPVEKTGEHYRFAVDVVGKGETELVVQERLLRYRREEIQQQSLAQLQRFLQKGLIDKMVHEKLSELLQLWERIGQSERQIEQIEGKQKKLYRGQEQIQKSMTVLSTVGKEGALRNQYVAQLESSEKENQLMKEQIDSIYQQIARWQAEIKQKIKELK